MLAARTKIFIIDDNVMIRFALTELFNREVDMVVVGDASSSPELMDQIAAKKPDILIYDIPLPRDQGIEYLRKISKLKLPAIVFTREDEAIAKDLIPLLESGAVGFVLKPDKNESISEVKDQLIHEIRKNRRTRLVKPVIKVAPRITFTDPLRVVAIGSSTGGPEALMEVLSHIPGNFSPGITCVQHMPPDFTTRFAQRLNDNVPLAVKEAANDDFIETGRVLLAPGGLHMTFIPHVFGQKIQSSVKLTLDPPQWGLRPTVDQMLSSLAPIYGNRLTAVILTGMGEDGVVGTRAVKKYGGRTIVQDKESSVVFGMGQEVIKNNLADEVLPLRQIARRIMELNL